MRDWRTHFATSNQERVNVYGVCASPSMIAALRGRYPQIPVECAAAKDSDLFGLTFDGMVACGRDARGPTP
jgi:hypothetical protein